MTRKTDKLKVRIYDILKNDVTLQVLLGGTDKVRHGNPEQLSDYPMVTYSILGEIDEAYNADLPSSITRSTIIVQSYTQSTQSSLAQEIDDRVYELLHGKQLSDATVRVYSCYRKTTELLYEAEIGVWRAASTYSVANVTL